mgnify:CR=1 FL=1
MWFFLCLRFSQEKCEARMEVDHLAESAEVQNPTSVYFQDPLEYAMDRYNYYLCFRCKKPYFGGERACDQPAGYSSTFDESELVCGSCVAGEGLDCPRHGKEFLSVPLPLLFFLCHWRSLRSLTTATSPSLLDTNHTQGIQVLLLLFSCCLVLLWDNPLL